MNVFSTILIALGGGALPAAMITGIFTFRVQRASSVKILAEAGEVSKRTALAEAEKALVFSDVRYEKLDREYERCHTRLDDLRKSVEPLIDAVEVIVARVRPANGEEATVTVTSVEVSAVRGAVREARRHLN